MPAQTIVSGPSGAALFIVLKAKTETPEGVAAIRGLLGGFPGYVRSVNFRYPERELDGVIGISDSLWDRITSAPKPKHLHPFKELNGAKHAPSTPGDMILHIRALSLDLCWELFRIIKDKVGDYIEIIDETHAFKFFDNRDLLGFVDGTANPDGNDALEAVHIGGDDPRYRDGSYLITQKYVHDLAAWNALSVEDQEKAIGRSKLDDIEMNDDVKPKNSHVALNDIGPDIYRLNMPFGNFSEDLAGTYFAGYARDPQITEEMLRHMFIGNPEGNYDRLLDFSVAKTGTLFFIPAANLLADWEDEMPLPLTAA